MSVDLVPVFSLDKRLSINNKNLEMFLTLCMCVCEREREREREKSNFIYLFLFSSICFMAPAAGCQQTQAGGLAL